MISQETIAIALISVISGYVIHLLISHLRHTSTKELLTKAQEEAERLKRESEVEAKDAAIRWKEQAEKEAQSTKQELTDRDRRLEKREDSLTRQQELLTKKEKYIEELEQDLSKREKRLSNREVELDKIYEQEIEALKKVTHLSEKEAKEMLLEKLQSTMDQEMDDWVKKRIKKEKEEADQRAREIIITTIQRTAAEHTSECVVSSVELPSDSMKGRIIGREGRNIRAFEKAAGVDVIVDETPGVVVVSGFDPVRRETARRAMIKLISDGRIHPARIEELIEQTKQEMDQVIEEAGKNACFELGLHSIHTDIQNLLGRLQFRTSYGQNILDHSIEVAHLMSVMAAEIGLDPLLAKRSGLLHDVGKAIDHEMEGGHPEIGAEFAKRHGEEPIVVNAIAAHHQGCESISLYPALVAAADAISAARPGARRESLDRYIKRLERLEEVVHSFEGVEQAYAIQAGREIRVLVRSDIIKDSQMNLMGRDIANRIEEELRYPGEIKVTLMRETRVVEYAR